MHVSGQCLCGEVQFNVDAPSIWCAHCHCSMCRLAHGAGFVTWVGYKDTDVEITDAGKRLAWYRSSPEAERGFCSRCGSTLFFRSTRWPGELHVTRGSIAGDIDREPGGHAFYESHVEWISLADTPE
jgi:hypothetical protein